MKKPLKITLTLSITIIMLLGFVLPLNPAGNWYQQFLPNIGSRTILDITFLDSLTGYLITTISADTSYILKTTDSGDSWSINHRATSSIFRRIQFINNNTGYVGGQHLIKTTNGGSNWFLVYPSLFAEDIYFISNDTAWYADPNSLVGGVFFTSNGGASWQQQFSGGNQNPNKIYMYNGRIGFMSNNSASPNIYKTTNSGVNWTINLPGENFTDMYFIDSLTGWKCSSFESGFIRKTTNGGINWNIQTIPPEAPPFLFSRMNRFTFINADTIWGVGGTYNFGSGIYRGVLYKTTNGGINWGYQIPDTAIHIPAYSYVQFTDKNKGWAYLTAPTGIHTRLGGDTTLLNVNQISNEKPEEFGLFQNYPNPFNPVTKITYQLHQGEHIILKVFDINGKEIVLLVNQYQRAGFYQVTFNGGNYSSGVYFYQLTVSNGKEVFTQTKKMLLVK